MRDFDCRSINKGVAHGWKKERSKILNFNIIPAEFNFEEIQVEELERRLELAITPLVMGFFDCPNFAPNCVEFDCPKF